MTLFQAYGMFMVICIYHINAQQTLVTYNITDATESMNFTVTWTSRVSNLISVPMFTELSETTVRVDVCITGSYSHVDSQTCTLCPQGKYSPTIAAVSIATCLSCGSGKYQNDTGATSEAQCQLCPINTYNTNQGSGALTECQACPTNSRSAQGSSALTSCVCAPGYSGPNGKPSRIVHKFLR